MTRKKRVGRSYRQQFKFWLDVSKDEEKALAKDILMLKDKRLFSEAIRIGLDLYLSLKANDTRVLFKEFPELETQLKLGRIEDLLKNLQGGSNRQPIGTLEIPVYDDADLEVKRDEDSGKRANQNFLNSIQAIAGETLTKPAPQGIQQIAIKPAPMPDFDDD